MNFPLTGPTRSTTPFTQGPRDRGVGWSGVYLFKDWFTTHAWQFLIIFSVASSIPGQNKTSSKKLFGLYNSLMRLSSCASDRICFRRDCGTTIRFLLRIAPSRIDNSSFMRLHGSRSVSRDHFPFWIWTSNLESVTSLLVSHLVSERVTAWRSDMFDMHVNKSYIIFANETGIWTIILLGWQSRHRICCGGVPRGRGGGGYSHTLPIRVSAAQRGRDFEAPDLERGIHFRGVFCLKLLLIMKKHLFDV